MVIRIDVPVAVYGEEEGETFGPIIDQSSANGEQECQSRWSMSEEMEILKDANSPFCNVTWDSILCWPLIPANRTIRLPCPPPAGWHQELGHAERHCRQNGPQRSDGEVNLVSWSDYSQCYHLHQYDYVDQQDQQHSELAGVQQQQHNGRFAQIDEIWMAPVDSETGLMDSVAAIEHGARQLEIIGLVISVCALCTTIFSLYRCRRLCIPANLARPHLLVSALLLALTKLVVLLDTTTATGGDQSSFSHTWCQVWYFLVEFFKSCLSFWFFFRCLALFVDIVISYIRRRAANGCPYLFLGWLFPILISITWVSRLLTGDRSATTGIRCPELFYYSNSYWSVLTAQLIVLVLSAGLLTSALVLLRVQYRKTRTEIRVETSRSTNICLLAKNGSAAAHPGAAPELVMVEPAGPGAAGLLSSSSIMTSSAAGGGNQFMMAGIRCHRWQAWIEFAVLLLLALPFVLRMFFYAPNLQNLHLVVSLQYVATFFSMFQGLFAAMLYGFAQMFIPVCGHKNAVVLRKYHRLKTGE